MRARELGRGGGSLTVWKRRHADEERPSAIPCTWHGRKSSRRVFNPSSSSGSDGGQRMNLKMKTIKKKRKETLAACGRPHTTIETERPKLIDASRDQVRVSTGFGPHGQSASSRLPPTWGGQSLDYLVPNRAPVSLQRCRAPRKKS